VVNRYQNLKLYSPTLKDLISKKDASSFLKDEISESVLRLKAVKCGSPLKDIVP